MVRNSAKILKVECKWLKLGGKWMFYNNIIAYSPRPHNKHTQKYQGCASKNSWKGREKNLKRRNESSPGISFQPSFHGHSSGSFNSLLMILERKFQHKGWRPPRVPRGYPGTRPCDAQTHPHFSRDADSVCLRGLPCSFWACRVSSMTTLAVTATTNKCFQNLSPAVCHV